jgi:DNA repair protein RecN (Recombination protein N)
MEFLKFQADELAKANPQPGEEEYLESERRRLAHAERLSIAAAEATDLLLDGEQSNIQPVIELLRQVSRLTAEIVAMDPDQEPIAADAEQLRHLVHDLGERLRDYAATVQSDPRRLQELDDRLALLRGLRRKYQAEDSAALAATLAEIQSELERIEHVDWELAADEKAYAQALKNAREAAAKLARLRREAARDFEALVEKEMADLELPGAQLRVDIQSRSPRQAPSEGTESLDAPELGPDGADTIEFLVALNPGTPLQPLRKVASGGEVARIMLAIKCVLATSDDVPTLVFDEIDVGISGQAAACVGEKLDALARHHQVLCITHLPQVAARGNQHILVEKVLQGDTARTEVILLQPDQRRLALAKMLGGHNPNDEALRYAQKLLSGG